MRKEVHVAESLLIDGSHAKAVAALIKSENIGTRTCVLGLPANQTLLDRLRLPGVKRAVDRERAARLTIKKRLPYALEDARIVVEPTKSDVAKIGVVHRDHYDAAQAFGKAARLKPVALEPEAMCWRRLVPQVNGRNEVDGVVHVADTYWSLTVFDGGFVRVTTMTREPGEIWIDQVGEAILNLRANDNLDARRLYLVGDEQTMGYLPDLEERSRSTITPFEVVDPRTKETVLSPDWLFAYGLATYGFAQPNETFNLFRASGAYKVKASVFTTATQLAGISLYPALAIILVLFVFGFEQYRVYTISSDRDVLQRQQLDLQAQRARLLALKDAALESLVPLMSDITDIRKSGERAADSIALLGTIRPPHVWIDSINSSNGGQVVSGGAPSLKAVSQYIDDIDRSLKRKATLQNLHSAKGRSTYLVYNLDVGGGP
jgi:hypothetical protein